MPEPKQSGAPAGSPGVAGAGVNVKALEIGRLLVGSEILVVAPGHNHCRCLVAWLMAKARVESQRKAATAATFGHSIRG